MDQPLSSLVPVLGTALLPFTSFISLSIFLSTHPKSPTRNLVRRQRIALPVHRNEGLDGELDTDDDPEAKEGDDPFEIDDPVVRGEGIPVHPEQFWASAWKRKASLLVLMLLPTACNIAILVMTATSRYPNVDEKTNALLVPSLILASHVPTLMTMVWYLSHDDTRSNWQTTIHLSSDLAVQFLVIALFALMPSTPPPRRHAQSIDMTLALFSRWDVIKLPPMTPLRVLQTLLPILQSMPLLVVAMIRRGPPIHLPLQSIYPPKIVEAVPPLHESLDPHQRNVSQEVEANVLEWLYFSYATPVIKKGSTATSMDVWDVPILPPSLRAMNNFLAIRKTYILPRSSKWEGYNLLWMIAKINAGLLTAMLSLAAVTAVLYYLPHYILQLFIVYLENDPTRSDPAWGWLLALSLFVANASVFVITGITWSITTTYLQGRINIQLNSMLFAKTLKKKDVAGGGDKKEVSKAVKPNGDGDEKDEGEEDEEDEGVASKSQIMNLFTVDVDRVNEFVFHAFSIIDSPIEIIVATLFLVQLLGTSALWGLLTSLLCMPLTHFASKFVVRTQENLMKARDKRTSLMNEILQGIRMLKFMAWERSFQKRVNNIRADELHWQARTYQIEVAFNALWEVTPILVTVVAFLHYTLVAQKTLSPSIAFTSIAVFDELRFALATLPETFIQALQGESGRIEKYLRQEEVSGEEQSDGEGDIVLSGATYTWPRDADIPGPTGKDGASLASSVAPTPKATFSLAGLNIRFPHGKLSLICGRLGSGKSLLLAGLLGEADLLTGHVECPRSAANAMRPQQGLVHDADHIPRDDQWIIPGMVGYVPQQAWLQNASIKDNIVFSSPWSESRYRAVLEACSLVSDLEILEDGDETEIGEKGLNLSGGQKARVSLARAVYSRAGTLLLDDVLSAVDAHTAHAIMENCFNGPITNGRTILLVSHHTALVAPSAWHIVALENGDVKFTGTKEEFVACGLMAQLDEPDKQGGDPGDSPVEEKAYAEAIKAKPANKSIVDLQDSAAGEDGSNPSSETSSLAPEDEATLTSSMPDVKSKPPRKLIEDERRATGRISWDVWRTYLSALGGPMWWLCFFVAIFVSMLAPPLQKGWLKYWTGSDPNDPNTHSPMFFVVGYSLVTFSGVWMDGLQYAVMYWGSLKASKTLHGRMLETVLLAPLRFHDTTSRGRLLNRFGKDVEGLDSEMADHFVRSISYGLSVVVTFISIAYVGGLPFVGATGVALVLYYKAGSIYGQTSRDMRRLNSVTRSPLYSLFGETVSGVSVIRAFGASTIELRKMLTLADTNVVAYAWTWTVNRWLSARFNILSSLIVGATALICLLAPGVNAPMAGFALAFANSIQHDLLFVVRRFVQLEQSMVALERIKEYTEIPKEAAEVVEPRPPASWPHEGALSVEKLVIRYAPDLPNVLHQISFSVQPRNKIGIVGATGCGKSTLALSFFRFVEAHSGRIVIDGIDISKIGLTDLRSRVTIIPQDPTILSGSLRSTLDVFDEYDDADIYAALKRVHLLKEDDDTTAESRVVAEQGEDTERNENVFKDLSNPVSEGGDNFSTGEKQLICMARAILRRNKVLLMDEATASIDYETDALISKTIREEFSESTILTIAHRIHTIIDFDKVLVMDKGNIAEYASPAELLRDHKSKFYALCKATGRTEFKNLKAMAIEAERGRKELVA